MGEIRAMSMHLKLKSCKKRVCKLILVSDYTTLDVAYKQLCILSFEETVFIHKAKVMYKIANIIIPHQFT